jgi:CO/xanthine dehydrogenase Mo-binding subunit
MRALPLRTVGGTVTGRKDNLKPWKPGQSGNPGGRPKRDLAAEIARAIFEQDSEAITRAFAAELKKGNAKVFAALADRAYGKPRQQVEHVGEDGDPIQTSVVVHFVRTGSEEKAK